jgi:hypothetical protein
MSEEISFVEVIMVHYEPEDKEYQAYFENEVHCFLGNWEECSEEIQEVVVARKQKEENEEQARKEGRSVWGRCSVLAYAPDTLIIQPLTTFRFNFFGQNFDRNYAGGLEWEVREMDYDYIFKDNLEELKEMGMKILADKKAMGHPKANNLVRFVTLWSWRSYQHSYYNEWDSEWELLGLVDPKKVHLMLKEK